MNIKQKLAAYGLSSALVLSGVYLKAGGKTLRGLTRRRQAENKMCLEGVAEYEASKQLEGKVN